MVELRRYTVTWKLEDGRLFQTRSDHTAPERAADRMYVVTGCLDRDSEDGQRWERMGHRALDIGDEVLVDGEPYTCLPHG